jgi:agmatinase
MAFDPNAPAATDRLFGLESTPQDAAVLVIPVPYEGTVSYAGGTGRGPEAVRAASLQVDLLDHDFGAVWEAGLAELDPVETAEADPDRAGEQIRRSLRERAAAVLSRGKIPGVLGGEHSVSLGAIEASAASVPELGVLQIDAHMDLRDAFEGHRYSHASVMFNVLRECPRVSRLVQVGIRDYCQQEADVVAASHGRVRVVYDRDVAEHADEGRPLSALWRETIAALPGDVYVSVDIDGLDPSLCPHTGTPVPGGLSFTRLCSLLRALAESGRRVVGFDLVEVAPGPDHDQWDGNVGARVLYKLAGCALASRNNI